MSGYPFGVCDLMPAQGLMKKIHADAFGLTGVEHRERRPAVGEHADGQLCRQRHGGLHQAKAKQQEQDGQRPAPASGGGVAKCLFHEVMPGTRNGLKNRGCARPLGDEASVPGFAFDA